ncbi:hypothetical protein [Bacillus solitudinis]|uniref:hypothetical protein n=1 Tax=Bacillus solitudinis TaxID=2014074 RepID=UPI0012FE2E37|nr:hypothetical protein [Bacillus solitudinis]
MIVIRTIDQAIVRMEGTPEGIEQYDRLKSEPIHFEPMRNGVEDKEGFCNSNNNKIGSF